MHPNSLANLKPVKKGEVRNPLGRAVPGYLRRKEMLEKVANTLVKAKNADGEEIECPVDEAIAWAQVRRATKGDTKAADWFYNRLDGRVIPMESEPSDQPSSITVTIVDPKE